MRNTDTTHCVNARQTRIIEKKLRAVAIGDFFRMGDVTNCISLGTHAVGDTMDRLLEPGHDSDIPVAVVYHASGPDEDSILGTIGRSTGARRSDTISESKLHLRP